jgi:hypothetical protein
MAKVVFDPTKVNVNIGGVDITGWADGEICSAEYDEDEVTVHQGTGGEFRFILSLITKGVFTVRTADYSLVNAVMTAIRAAKLPVPVIVTDKSSAGDLFNTASAMIQKMPKFIKSNEANMHDWPMVFGKANIVLAGAPEA